MNRINKRTRSKAPKSRLGCSRCKSRRIKCDETRPACQNCIKIGCSCPGFQQVLRWSTKEIPADQSRGLDSLLSADQTNGDDDSSQMSQGINIASAPNASHDGLDDLAVDPSLPWLPRLPTPLQTTAIESGVRPDAGDTWDTSVNPASGIPDSQYRAPAHLPTELIEHWFCHTSYNRQLAWNSWSTSKAVFYTIQAMSAARLSVSTPQFRYIERSLRSQAAMAIDEAIYLVRNSQSPKVTSDLVYAVFTLGNSWNCTTSTVSNYPWLESARELLSIWGTQLSCSDTALHAYFSQALGYWEMLLAAAGRGSVPLRLESKRRHYHVRLYQGLQLSGSNANGTSSEILPNDPEQSLLGTRPNSWSGISNEVIDVFGHVLALCCNMSRHSKNTGSFTTVMASEMLCDLSIAHDLQRQLLAMDFETLVLMDEIQGFPVQTGDDNTPIGHLLQTAEAYRQAALLQLHLAFSDLPMVSREAYHGFSGILPTDGTDNTVENQQSRATYLLSLTLDLVALLHQIPPQSGSRSIHLMLYLSAATGLRFETMLEPGRIPNADDTTDSVIPRSTMEVSRSRDLVLTRLSSLQQTLPHRRMEETVQFVRDIWRQYDDQESQCLSIAHWLDTITEKGLVVTLW
ncbi:hypothetical protein BDV37DRAFT_276393 [Aspergillus pseudonomiae]|uniref:Zn(2)-C6 fungal-type domain-containing protein n=1 Tax=Aspergillus pseudonomiae TaxID=1506151 RepID=A0A5N7CVV4_9EURO|nr:uncharacterized protein BDV37DRAFT_276393 [Aspergillus pseudonomiae]KAE8398109.1 hypothetical protein BDV37DRAFT_276393 [Aspergillus pseudonomiae]